MSNLTALSDPANCFWDDPATLKAKLEKTIGSLLAVKTALQRRESHSAAESEFLRLVSWAESLEAEAFENTFSDPRAYHFARTAFDLFAMVHCGSEVSVGTQSYLEEIGHFGSEALDDHLQQFGWFAVSLALGSSQSIAFSPMPMRLPDCIPATRWSFESDRKVQLCGSRGGGIVDLMVDDHPQSISLTEPKSDVESLRIHRAAIVETIRLQPPMFNVPGLRDIRSVVPASVEGQIHYCDTLRQALRLISVHSASTYGQLTSYMKVIGFKPPGYGGVFNTSCSRLPGAAIFTGARHPLVLADDLIHEFYHNRLFALEEQGDFFHRDAVGDRVAEDPSVVQTYYSPWRDDPRPIYGVFHAAFVFERVLWFWISVIDSDELEGIEHEYAMFRAAKLNKQLQIAMPQLLSWATFTETGQSICNSISESLHIANERCEALGAIGDLDAIEVQAHESSEAATFDRITDQDGRGLNVSGILRMHIAQCDTHHRCKQVLSEKPESCSRFLATIANLLEDCANANRIPR